MRKIIQICAIPGGNAGIKANYPALFALCNDTTLWQISNGNWIKISDIPQTDYKEEENMETKNEIGSCENCGHYIDIAVYHKDYANIYFCSPRCMSEFHNYVIDKK